MCRLAWGLGCSRIWELYGGTGRGRSTLTSVENKFDTHYLKHSPQTVGKLLNAKSGRNLKKQPRKAKGMAGAVGRNRKIPQRNRSRATRDVAAATGSGQRPDRMVPALPAEPMVPALPAEYEESKASVTKFSNWFTTNEVSIMT